MFVTLLDEGAALDIVHLEDGCLGDLLLCRFNRGNGHDSGSIVVVLMRGGRCTIVKTDNSIATACISCKLRGDLDGRSTDTMVLVVLWLLLDKFIGNCM